MTKKEFFLTPEGYAKLEAELEQLRSERRKEIADNIQAARQVGGTEDNAEYEDAKN